MYKNKVLSGCTLTCINNISMVPAPAPAMVENYWLWRHLSTTKQLTSYTKSVTKRLALGLAFELLISGEKEVENKKKRPVVGFFSISKCYISNLCYLYSSTTTRYSNVRITSLLILLSWQTFTAWITELQRTDMFLFITYIPTITLIIGIKCVGYESFQLWLVNW